MIKDHLCNWHGLQISNVMIKVQHYVIKFFSDLQQQASTLTFVRLSGTSENWRRRSRSCITVVRRDQWKSQIPKRAGKTDKSISTENFFFCLTLGQTGSGVLFDPWPLCLSHHFFVILYITCQILFFIQNWMQDYLYIVMII
jgi:hypothetical protein